MVLIFPGKSALGAGLTSLSLMLLTAVYSLPSAKFSLCCFASVAREVWFFPKSKQFNHHFLHFLSPYELWALVGNQRACASQELLLTKIFFKDKQAHLSLSVQLHCRSSYISQIVYPVPAD